MSKKNILYIEDNRDTASAVKIILEGAGCNVELAYTGKTALKIAKNGFDLFGLDIFEKLKNTKSKFVFLSVIPVSKERIRELKKAGISDYITKPFVKEDLIKRVQKILKS